MPVGSIEVVGLKEFQRQVRRSTDKGLPKRLGQANKEIGQLVIDRLQPAPDPAAVGRGAGAAVRPSASKREVLLRVGGKHRAGYDSEGRPLSPRMQWGKRTGRRPGQPAPKRPYIRETVERHRKEIGRKWIKAVAAAMKPAFHDTKAD